MKKRGKFIAIEGIDGAGTTTQSGLLGRFLEEKGIDVTLTAEPTDGEVGGLIRNILGGASQSHPQMLALLFAADRIDHYKNLVEPELEKGVWVVSDRYVFSSLAYQSVQCDPAWIESINSRAPHADLTVLLDLDAGTAMERLGERAGKVEIFEKKQTLEKVRQNYLNLVQKATGFEAAIVDASAGIEEVKLAITEMVREKLLIGSYSSSQSSS